MEKKTNKMREGAVEFSVWKKELFEKRPGVKEEYDALEPKYALISAMLDARNRKGMTQADIAKRAGTTQSAIARFESGRTNPTLDFATRLSSALGAKLEIRLAK
ncbi:MAG: helix-turn-helix transcriptional regulator [Candidatus Kaiserbacteria bacterium]|nr:helix-turn-helix transcriptional regulator [Candidatus Kaiserbacteria bacterium]